MSSGATFTPITNWGRWIYELAQSSDSALAESDVAEVNLRCAEDLPGTDNELLHLCLEKIDDWGILVARFTRQAFPYFLNDAERFQNSEARFRAVALADCLQREVGIRYNFSFAEGEYDASDSRNLFIHGILTGFGGTCASMPVLYCAVGRRLGYPLTMGEASEHCFCRWDDDSGEHFCFDAAGRGCYIRDEDYYRKWPKPITPAQERNNGLIRRLTPHEELAAFAAIRGNCLFDSFCFVPAVEAYYLAHSIAPHKHCFHDAWGLAVYSSKLWAQVKSLPDALQDAPFEEAIVRAADSLRGPNIELYRGDAIQNVFRIVRNRNHRDRAAVHEAAFQELMVE
jgi:hypothetical protein